MSERQHHIEVRMGSERNFGIVFAVLFLILALWPLLDGSGIRLWALGAAAVFGLTAFVVPKVLSFPNRLWFKFGILLGALIAPVVMALVYFFTVVP
ncbi:MAG: hypothetical protein K8F25_11575, partial [Fimbriimonadaceae bacterium]|nr:hypothetical protein [Alphaproteobacteria bacterium]